MFVRFFRVFALIWMALSAVCASAWATDNFPGTTLTGSSGSLTGTTVGATGQTGEPTVSDGSPAIINSIWYSWTAPASGRFTMATCNPTGSSTTNYDTTLGSYTGAAVGSLTLIQRNNNTTGCLISSGLAQGSTVSLAATAGTTYRFRVDGSQAATGTYALYWGLAAVTVTVTDASATEGGDTASFTVRPVSPPANGTNISIAIGTSTQCSFSPTPLTFTPSNWQTARTVTVTATNDAVSEGTHSCSPASITATGGGYTTTTATPATLTVYDNDGPSFTIAKSADPANISAPGIITYTITVDNNGTAVLTSPIITDALTLNGNATALTSGPTLTSGDTNSDGILQDTETWIYTATYAVTQANINTGGSFSNTATFDPAQLPPTTSSAATTTITQTPAIQILKGHTITTDNGIPGVADAGDIITYTYDVTNNGNVTLSNVAVTDAHGGAGSLSAITPANVASLAPAATAQFTATYLTLQADVDNQ